MRNRMPAFMGAIAGALGLAALGWAVGWPGAAVAIAAMLGLLAGAVVGQGLAWLRTTAGRVARLEVQQSRLDSVLRDTERLKAQAGEMQASLARIRADAQSAQDALRRDLAEARKSFDDTVRLSAVDSDTKVTAAVESARVNLRTRMEELAYRQSVERRQVRTLSAQRTGRQTSLLESYLQLQRLVPMPLPMPRPGSWAASEDLLLWLVGDVLEHHPGVVLDLGSGQSSVWMAGAMRAAGYDGLVIGVDHDEAYARATEDLGRRQGVSPWLRVIHAPLLPGIVDGREVSWYDVAALEGVEGIGLMCVDGPPSVEDAEARWPALPLLRDRLDPGARVVLDDMVREGEQTIAADWAARFPEMQSQRMDFEKGALVLTMP